MNLDKFAETYLKLEKKCEQILSVYGLVNYTLQSIDVENCKGSLQFNITCEYYICGCTETEYLTFNLEEMNNDIKHFETKYKEKIKKEEHDKKIAKQKETERRRLLKETKDKAEYKRLKLKYEGNTCK